MHIIFRKLQNDEQTEAEALEKDNETKMQTPRSKLNFNQKYWQRN